MATVSYEFNNRDGIITRTNHATLKRRSVHLSSDSADLLHRIMLALLIQYPFAKEPYAAIIEDLLSTYFAHWEGR